MLYFQTIMTKDCELEIVSKTMDSKILNVLNQIANARENFDNDFFQDIAVYRTKRFQNHFVEFVSRTELDVIELIEASFLLEAKRLQELEDIEFRGLSDIINKELEELLLAA